MKITQHYKGFHSYKIHHQIDTTDKQIDKLVYNLYNLTEEEIRIVEENAE